MPGFRFGRPAAGPVSPNARVRLVFPVSGRPPRPPHEGPMLLWLLRGAYVALSIMAPGDWAPEAHWRPDRDGTPLLVNPDLDAAARAAGALYGYTRSGAEGAVTVFLPRLRD